jgi:predicted NAD/FAD-binding protein
MWFVAAVLLAVALWFAVRQLRPKRVAAPIQGRKVAVIGGGIAGCSAAWSLARAGADVHIFETRPTLGGNAKTHVWSTDPRMETGLSVLAWPHEYFRNYTNLLRTLQVATQDVQLRFYVDNEGDGIIAHDQQTQLKAELAPVC